MILFTAIIKKNRITLGVLFLSLPLILLATGNLTKAAEDADIKNAVSAFEAFYAFFITLAVSLIIKNRDELTISLTCDIKMKKLFFIEYIIILIFSFVPALAFSLIYIPRWMLGDYMISFTVTAFFLSALALLIRVLVNNHFANLGFSAVFFMIFYVNTTDNSGGGKSIAEYYLDPFINTYKHIIIHTGEKSVWHVTDTLWMTNRIIFGALGIICLIMGLILSERINIYKNKQSN